MTRWYHVPSLAEEIIRVIVLQVLNERIIKSFPNRMLCEMLKVNVLFDPMKILRTETFRVFISGRILDRELRKGM